MLKYRNKRTGNVILVPCPVSGPDWEELVEAKAEPEVAPGKKAAPPPKGRNKGGENEWEICTQA